MISVTTGEIEEEAMSDIKHGDFTNLAENYAKYRPGYSDLVRDLVAGLLPLGGKVADVGAGTGIWSKQLAEAGFKVTAVEPNEAMRREGEAVYNELLWIEGSAENTGLSSSSYDLVSMASSFHWTDFSAALKEFHRILKSDGYFLALWNTRNIVGSPLLEDIESKIYELIPNMERISSGKSVFCDNLSERLENSKYFANIVYLEGNHVEFQTPQHYLGLWESVNDIRAQAGEEKFNLFLDYIKTKTQELSVIEAKYKTRAWLACRQA
jgi:ubiquinone/menaquinone biosynthesis C-methylase UbiE